MLDSGTTFTYLPSDAFQSFKETVTAFALEHGLKSVKGPDPKVGTRCVWHCLCCMCSDCGVCKGDEYTARVSPLQSCRAAAESSCNPAEHLAQSPFARPLTRTVTVDHW